MDKKEARLRRAKRTRIKMRELNKVRLCVNKTPQHTYAQIISGDGSQVLVTASTVEKSIKENVKHGGNVSAAEVIGTEIAKRAVDKGITEVAFDRSGFKYHGRVKALADAARKHGLNF
ncbi:50S ribosomal protein L18 [Fangia hongkongensis]|uniref:50S ribosomal protein L18 n=1 Tax=Fangia hongkongensis TaxID=270495 RepID=UPI00036AB4FD|nr:50S ribosomal protein L18 [Fangia hongkongensis]MBK2125987.1 50S ribosomal protein L18 [Fangia hongkongensis]